MNFKNLHCKKAAVSESRFVSFKEPLKQIGSGVGMLGLGVFGVYKSFEPYFNKQDSGEFPDMLLPMFTGMPLVAGTFFIRDGFRGLYQAYLEFRESRE